jgi:hypothetical protein
VKVATGLPVWKGPNWSALPASIHASNPDSAASRATWSHALERLSTT